MLLRKTVAVVLSFFIGLIAGAQNSDKTLDYINTYKEIAIKEMQRTGVPAAITLAQGILESESGNSGLAQRSNNHFGIKCKDDWKGQVVYHDDDAKGECFRSYDNPEQSYIDHSDFLRGRPHYSSLFSLDPTDFEGWAKGLKKAGYATSSTYATRLIGLIQRYNLQQYTLIALQKNNTPTADVAVEPKEAAITPTLITSAKDDVDKPILITKSEEEIKLVVPAMVKGNNPTYPSGVFTINMTKVTFVKEGTSLLALANQYNISYKKLLEFNDLDESTDILAYDQLIFLGKKQKRGTQDFHIVAEGETIELISQREGIQLYSLLTYNRMPRGRQPQVGEKIYLKANSAVTPKLVASTN
jgi:hypothetical protein